jgi:hypothetical protein
VRLATTVRVGTLVALGAAVSVSRSFSVSVAVLTISVRVGTGVKVLLGVEVGVAETRGVVVGVQEGVTVGMVWVGKGPSSACAVPARLVLMAFRFEGPAPSPKTLELRNVM